MSHETSHQDADLAYFSEKLSAEVVNARIGPDADPRVREIVSALVRHLHDLVKEVEPTHEEWLAAIHFMTETGQMCNQWRQEYILLSDVLGISMLVDAISHRRPPNATANTVLGPFHIEGAPHRPSGANICLDGKGEAMVVMGRVMDTTGQAIAGATIDTWQTNDDGFYDVQQRGIQPDWNLRGIFTSESDGSFWYRSVKPRHYPIPDDGPVGRLLRALDRHPYRAAHSHYIVSAPGYEKAITHVFTPDCPYLREDAVFGVKDSLIGNFIQIDNAAEAERLGVSHPFWKITWDFVLQPID